MSLKLFHTCLLHRYLRLLSHLRSFPHLSYVILVTAFPKWQGPRFRHFSWGTQSLWHCFGQRRQSQCRAGAGRRPQRARRRGPRGREGGRPRPGCRPRQASGCVRNWGVTRNICDISLALIKTEISFPAHKTFVLPATDKEPQRLTQRESGPFRSRVKIQAFLSCVSFHNTELGVRSFILNSKSCRSW